MPLTLLGLYLYQLQLSQLECERATRFVAEQLKVLRPNQDTDVFEIFQEVTMSFLFQLTLCNALSLDAVVCIHVREVCSTRCAVLSRWCRLD